MFNFNQKNKVERLKNDNKSLDKIIARDISLTYNIKKSKNSPNKEFMAIQNVNLNVKSGEFLSVVGPSGCGKSTFLDIIGGLVKKNSGEVFIDGIEVNEPDLDRGIVMQAYALFPWRTIRKNVELGLEVKGINKKEREEISKEYIELVGLKGFEDRFPYELSGGMKQRVAIARALAYNPKVLLMDEPFAAIDEQTKELLHEELLSIWEKTHKTIIFVTHSIEEAIFLSDRVAVMTPNPGTIKEIIDINLPRPRCNSELRTSIDFGLLRHKIWELLHNNDEVKQRTGTTTNENIGEKISSTVVL